MYNKELLQKLDFLPKENESGIFYKKFPSFGGYSIEVDFQKNKFDFGPKIKSESGTTQNFSQEENWVVLECINRILEKGYKPEDITLEKTFPSGHGHSGRLDIFVKKEGKAFLMIECKTAGKEFEKELKSIYKDGGQLFTYFQNDTSTQYLMLYTSQLVNSTVEFKNEIVKIEDHYRNAGNVVDFYDRWNKITSQNGIFEEWVAPYNFESKLFTKKELKQLKESDSGFVFHAFLSILRKYSVSDKPNAFNKIFNLFLAKIYDEKKRDSDELDFQWKEKSDDAVSFQIRLINLYKDGMYEFLKKEIEGINDNDFKYETIKELQEKKKKWLKFNNVFAIKEVIDDESFDDNQRVLKEIVELLQRYQIRYPRRQQHLSDFFERLLTTGLKQESGQFFTPPPIAKFIVRSLPIRQSIEDELNQPVAKLPAVIDYAAGSGHFITEVMEQYQDIISNLDTASYYEDGINFVKASGIKPYDWAAKYVYGIEKDYRLVKVAKVGCYFYGDGLAQIIHGDGLDNFQSSKSYVGLLKENADDPQRAKFSFVISNPPYSVSSFKGDIKNAHVSEDFSLYKSLTDSSSEIECLFIERAKQLLKEGGVAALVLPSSILSNTGLYTKTREIILENFDIVSIVELGSNTFMATGTNTVTLFLRRRNNNNVNLKSIVNKFCINLQDVTLNGIEKPVAKYVGHVWKNISFHDYIGLLQKIPSKTVIEHEIFVEYKKKIKAKNEKEFWNIVIEKEKEKLYYFILAYPQKVVLVKTGEKEAEKRFLGYEFSNRRGSEGIHPIQRGKSIEECTQLFDTTVFDNPEKASTYIYKAFQGDFNFPIAESLQKNIFRHNLVDMLTFDRSEFEKNVSLSAIKKVRIESKWEIKKLGEISVILRGVTYAKSDQVPEATNKIVLTAENITLEGNFELNKRVYLYDTCVIGEEKKLKKNDIFICFSSGSKEHLGKVAFIGEDTQYYAGGFMGIIRVNKNNEAKYIYQVLNGIYRQEVRDVGKGSNINNLSSLINDIQIPLPPKNIQERIVKEIEILESKEKKSKEEVKGLKNKISVLLESDNRSPLKTLLQEINPNKSEAHKLDDNIDVSFLSMSDVSNLGIITNLQKRKLKDVKAGFTFFQKDDVLFAKITPCMENGKGALVPKLENNIGFGSTEFFVLRTNKEKLLPKILFYYTQSKDFRINAEKVMTGASGHRRVPKSFIESYEVTLFSLAEQQKIVTQIEKIEKQIDLLETNLQEFLKQKKEILKKYL